MGAMRTLALLSCVVAVACLAAGVGAASPTSNPFCCAREIVTGSPGGPQGIDCDKSLSYVSGSGGAAANPGKDRSSWVADCNKAYKDPGAPGKPTIGGAVEGLYCNDEAGQCTATPPHVQGDPHLVGLDGTHYILWGKANATYNLLSERHHQVNIRLFHPAGHPDNHALYIESVGLLIHSARMTIALARPDPKADAHLVLTVGSGPSATPITYAGRPVERAVDSLTSYAFRSPQKVTISSRDIVLSVVVSEGYYIDIMVDEVAAYWSDVHGVLGQTHEHAFKLKYNYARGTAVGELPQDIMREKQNRPYTIKGQEDDYITSGLLSADDKFTRFVPEPVPVSRKLFNQAAEEAQVERVRTMGAVLGA